MTLVLPSRRFVAARWGAPPDEPLPVLEAPSDLLAARALVPGLTATASLRPDAPAACALRIAITADAAWLIVEADGSDASHGPFWAGFHARERAELLAGWLVLRASPALLAPRAMRAAHRRRPPTARR
ncbi:MAG TPA: hypothetical protein VGR28_01490 [Candidatus Thermoplasmatota archaeon]|jgi:hypothetical protein|nr:hypothetical protein [Candidatus Thermoplasmatota archaeon]